jgi:sulfate transport system ATP-binding protein
MSFEVSHLHKKFGTFTALDGVSLKVARGEIVALLGPSGCGKTTLLRILAGLETADAGEVSFEGTDVTRTPAAARRVGLVFQHYALFEHMTVFENVAFGMRVRGSPAARVRERVGALLERVGLASLAARAPSQLSGGQRQRVALARALATEPRVLLLDEPFGALDAGVRKELRSWLRQLHSETRVTTVLVTHDREDAFDLADRVALMNGGRLEQVGPPAEVFHHPNSAWVMRFLGDVNELPVPNAQQAGAVGFVRPYDIELSRIQADPACLPARVRRVQSKGGSFRVEVDVGSTASIVADVDEQRFGELALQSGEVVFLSPRRVRFFDRGPVA